MSIRHLIAFCISAGLYALGYVPRLHLAFAIFSLLYTFLLSKTSFPLPSSTREPPVLGRNNRLLLVYMVVAGVIGLIFPLAYIAVAVARGDDAGRAMVGASAPHLFLLCAQIFMEGIAFSDKMALPMQVLVPVLYNAWRLPVIWDWLKWEFVEEEERLLAGRAVAVANMVLWCFNLFGFLVPVFLPKVFKRYYGAKKEA